MTLDTIPTPAVVVQAELTISARVLAPVGSPAALPADTVRVIRRDPVGGRDTTWLVIVVPS